MITFVSAFLCGTNPKRTPDVYKQDFDRLVQTGIPIVLFLDRTLTWTFPSNVHVVPASLDETWVATAVPHTAVLPQQRNPVDTLDYMLIQTSKTEWLVRASNLNPFGSEWFAWLDFGLAHVFKTPETTLNRIRSLSPPSSQGIRTAGIWPSPTRSVWGGVCWRFAGGFLMGDKDSLAELDTRLQTLIRRELPKMTWEVNWWALLESEGVDMGWFLASHDDTIIPS